MIQDILRPAEFVVRPKPLKTIEFDTYGDGYTAFEFNCIDIPIAGASGYYNYDNYYLYCFYYCIFSNWTTYFTEENEMDVRSRIFKLLGLSIQPIQVKTNKDLISTIKYSVDNHFPLLIPVKYRHMFYTCDYIINPNSHFWVVSGYDPIDPIIQIRDFPFIYDSGIKVNERGIEKGHGLYKLRLTEDIISSIWSNSNFDHFEEKSIFYDNVFSIKKSGDPIINNFKDAINDFINNYSSNQNQVISLFEKLTNGTEVNDWFIEEIRRMFYRSLIVVFEVIDKAFDIPNKPTEEQLLFYSFAKEYIDFRSSIINKIYANNLRNRKFSCNETSNLIAELNLYDTKLFSVIKNLLF